MVYGIRGSYMLAVIRWTAQAWVVLKVLYNIYMDIKRSCIVMWCMYGSRSSYMVFWGMGWARVGGYEISLKHAVSSNSSENLA